MAAATIANIVKSSLGPVGLDKMLVDDVGVRLRFIFWNYLLFCGDIFIYLFLECGLFK